MKTVLITGSSGFIGSHLVEEGLARGYQVWAAVRGSSNRQYLQDSRIHLIDFDLSDKQQLRSQIDLHGPWDYVIHNAGITKCVNSADFYTVNYLYSRNLIETLWESVQPPKKLALMSSLGAHHPGVRTLYGDSKLKAEKFLRAQYDIKYAILCPTGVYGPRDRDYYLMLKMLCAGWDFRAGFEPQRLSFIYVKDLARVAFMALESAADQASYAVSDGAEYSDNEFTALAKEVLGQAGLGKKRVVCLKAPLWALKMVCIVSETVARWRKKPATLNRDKYKIIKQRDWSSNDESLVRDLGFRPEYSLRRGLEEAVEWYKRNGWL
jgi:nucleoside-diphosphate-sugar epimerase